jgi:Tol biopolymer transport system component
MDKHLMRTDAVLGRVALPPESGQPFGNRSVMWMVVLTSALFVGGVYLDGWAHNHGRVDNTFFTPWHGVLYASYGAVVGVLAAASVRKGPEIEGWRVELPDGFGLSLVGVLIFGLGGLADMVWHTLFGVEASTAALLSPTHLLLAVGGSLLVCGPLRAAWRRFELSDSRWSGNWVAVLVSATGLLSMLTFMTQFANPWVSPQVSNQSQPTPPGMDVYVMNADGTAQRRLTNLHGPQAADAAWSPDGGALAIVVRDQAQRTTRLTLFDLDGNEHATLVSGSPMAEPILPAWSPDGRRLAYLIRSDDDSGGLYVLEVGGGNPVPLVSGRLVTAPVAWSPDASQVAYTANEDGAARLFVVSVDTGRVLPLKGGGDSVVTSWSPDGSRIAFGSDRDGLWQIYSMRLDGSDVRRLTDRHTANGRAASAWAPAWSPDGGRIAFQSDRSGTIDIFVMASDGSGVTNLTDNPSLDHLEPAWSSDGRMISFVARGHSEQTDLHEAFGVAAILIQAALLSCLVLLLVRRWSLPFGSLTLVFTLNAVLVSFLNDQFMLIIAAFVAGAAADALVRLLRPFEGSTTSRTRIFAFAVPDLLYSAYFSVLALTTGISWSVHLWAGSIVLAGIAGWLVSYLITAPAPLQQQR